METMTPANWMDEIFSLKTTHDMRIIIVGMAVCISETLMAVVVWAAEYNIELKQETPKNERINNHFQESMAVFQSRFTWRNVKGSRMARAAIHRQKARLTGGTTSTTPRASTAFPPQQRGGTSSRK